MEPTAEALNVSTYFIDYALAYFVALTVFVVGLVLYCSLTPHKEIALIRAGNPAAAVNFSATCFALAIPLAAAVHKNHNVMDIALWGANAVLFQLLAYFVFSRLVPEISKAIAEGKTVATLPLAALQICVALLNAAIFAA
jgi:putative membrane protein